MDHRRLIGILGELAATSRDKMASWLCGLSARELGVDGAGVMVMDGDALPMPLCASDAVAASIQDLYATLGEGPGFDAHQGGAAVIEPNLANPRRGRWPGFAPPALGAGAGAVFAFPLRIGGVRLGALTLHRRRAGPLSDAQYIDALAIADLVVQVVLARQADAPPGALARELEALGHARAEVHQAAGMVSVQLGMSVAHALLRLRAHAYAEGRPLVAVAYDVVARRLRLVA